MRSPTATNAVVISSHKVPKSAASEPLEAQCFKSVGDEPEEVFEDELPSVLRDVARRGLAWLEGDRMAVLKLNRVALLWLARFFPPGVCGSRLPEPLYRALGAWRRASMCPTALGEWWIESEGSRLVVRVFRDPAGPGVLLVMDLLPSFTDRLNRLGLTERESEVLVWIARGKTDPEIAMILGARPRTIEKHVEHILAKLGAENRTTAALMAIQAGLEHGRSGSS